MVKAHIGSLNRLLRNKAAIKKHHADRRRSQRMRELKSIVESIQVRGFSVESYKELQMYSKEINLTSDEAVDSLNYAGGLRIRNYIVRHF